jgi:hypothetical protein
MVSNPPERANTMVSTFAPWYILIPLVFAGDVVVATLAWTIVGFVMR